ncbi:hypothetical protein CLU79DRAFT_736545 [Phycomyces nitens]|nr:hypothetical protein CLU79DRAFT_736545 [Phycomyces nitens]
MKPKCVFDFYLFVFLFQSLSQLFSFCRNPSDLHGDHCVFVKRKKKKRKWCMWRSLIFSIWKRQLSIVGLNDMYNSMSYSNKVFLSIQQDRLGRYVSDKLIAI